MLRALIPLLLLIPQISLAQGTDTAKSDSSEADTLAPIPPNPYPSTHFDTISFDDLLTNTPLEHPFRPGLGNLGLDSYSLVPDVKGRDGIGYWIGLPQNPYTYPHPLPTTYDVRYPITRIAYSFGSNEEQFFNITHTQNITPRWNVAIEYRKFGSPGPYPRQRTNNGNFTFSTQYREAQGHYQVRASYQGDRTVLQQNGGILDPTVFEEDQQGNRAAFRTRLEEAQSEPSSDEIRLDHAFFPTGRDFEADSAPALQRKLGIYHQGKASNVLSRYKALTPDSGFYDNIHFDSLGTRDSIHYKTLDQTAGLLFQEIRDGAVRGELRLGFRYRLMRNSMMGMSEDLNDAALLLKGDWSFGRHQLRAKASYGTSGYGKGDHLLKGEWSYPFELQGSFDSLGGELSYKDRSPAYSYQRYRSNHFIWDQELSSVKTLHARARWGEPRRKDGLAISYTRKQNALYFDRSAHPRSADEELRFFRAHARQDFRFGKWGAKLQAIYQKEWSSDIVRVPEYIGRGELFFETPLFDQALTARFGARATYYAAYRGYAYMPAIRRFYLQDEPVTGDYPFFDLFIQGKVGSIRFFLELDHGNAGLMGYRYYGAPNYPLRDRMIRGGLKWDIYN